jgi:hypothetical protein
MIFVGKATLELATLRIEPVLGCKPQSSLKTDLL